MPTAAAVDWNTPGFATVREVATFLKLSRSLIYELMDQPGGIPYAKFGRSRRIEKRDVLAFAQRQKVATI